MLKKLLKRLIRTEKGQALPMVLVLMAVGGLILAPLLSHTSSGLKVSQTYERIANEFYAADAGVEDGLWHINFNQLDDIFTTYQRYDYATEYEYPITYPLEVNDMDVTVKIENIWIPKDITAPNYGDAEQLIGAGKLIIAGGVSAELTQQVKIYYYKDETDADLFVNKIGVWMPPGVSYDDEGECTLETWLDANYYDYSQQVSSHKGGQAIVWNLAEPILFTDFPEVNEGNQPMMYDFTFNFKLDDPESERIPEAVSWITTSGVSDIAFTWDADVRVFHINSQAGGTTINAYAIKSDLRQLVSGRSGDYRAIGNTLMLNLYADPPYGGPVRDYLLIDSDATADDIPENAQVEAAFLYWSAWVLASEEQDTLFIETCEDIYVQWDPGNDWSSIQNPWYGWVFQAHHSPEGNPELVMKEPLELSIYESGMVTVSLNYWISGWLESYDCLQYAFYNSSGWSGWYDVFCDDVWPGGATMWPQPFSTAVPDEYLTADFKMKFQITGFDGSGVGGYEYCYIDNIEVTATIEEETIADTEFRFEIDGEQVYLDDDEYGNPTVPAKGTQSIFANDWTVLENGPNDYSYACKADVTALVQEFTENGNAIYTVGDVYGDINTEWSYAGWSLIIIYTSPETQRQQLYLFDDFLYIAPWGNGVSFPISGFLVPDPIPGEENAAKITCFVGDGDDFYSGDFIAINAPDLPGYQIPNDYKLWDGVTLSPPSFPPYMPNNSGSPNNVWNGQSPELSATGVDIDTFYVPWGDPPSSGLLKPDDSAATISLNFADSNPSYAELINFIYIIISFRSDVVIGGTVSYIVDL